jgi:hypothetical protein
MKNYVHKIFASQNSKGKYESRKILDFVKKMRKNGLFLGFFISLTQLVSHTYTDDRYSRSHGTSGKRYESESRSRINSPCRKTLVRTNKGGHVVVQSAAPVSHRPGENDEPDPGIVP